MLSEISTEEKNQKNFSMIETQPAVHFSLISHYLNHNESISLFRSSTRLYSIPLEIPIFLNYFNEFQSSKKYFDFSNFLQSKIFSSPSALNSFSDSNSSSNFIRIFRFFISSIKISTEPELNEWRKLNSSGIEKFQLFSRLNELGVNFYKFSLLFLFNFLLSVFSLNFQQNKIFLNARNSAFGSFFINFSFSLSF